MKLILSKYDHSDSSFMVYTNTTKVLLYYDPQTYQVKRSHHYYIDEHGILIQPK